MQERRQRRHVRITRTRTVADVTVEVPTGERSQPTPGFAGYATQPGGGAHTAVNAQRRGQRRNVVEVDVAVKVEPCGADPDARRLQPNQKFVAAPRKLRSQRTRGGFAPPRHVVDRHDDIAFDLNDTPSGLGGDTIAPRLLLPQVAAVANDERGAPRERD